MTRPAGRPLILMALEVESQGLIEQTGHEVLYIGVGKLNAAYTLMRRLAQGPRPAWVLNLGSAGSGTFKRGEVVAATQFIQRDMDATGLGFRHGETPFDPHPYLLEFAPVFPELSHGICGSGDSFLQGLPPIACDIIDMEAYALARICHLESLNFACVKYITDGADGTAHTEWTENVRLAAQAFVRILEGIPVKEPLPLASA